MEKLAVSPAAQDALVRFLIKLELVDPVNALGSFSSTEQCPIAFYAGKGSFQEWDAITKVAEKLGLPRCRLDKESLAQCAALLNNELIKRVPISRWLALRAAPVKISADEIMVMFANPLDHEARSIIEFDLEKAVRVAIGREDELVAVLGTKQPSGYVFDLNLLFAEKESDAEVVTTTTTAAAHESDVSGDDAASAPVIRLVNRILAGSVHLGASDVHLTPEKEHLNVRVRVDGAMRPLLQVPSRLKAAVLARIKVLAAMDLAEKRKPQDGRLRIKTGIGIRDLRISSVPSVHGESIVARILAPDAKEISFSSLGMPPALMDALSQQLCSSSRVILVSGPTGSGKTSTLYATLLSLNDGVRNIISVEDPVEYRLPGITQIQVNTKTGMTFAAGLRAILRQDPDVIMVGEIRDQETAEIAMQSAQTGHLVLSTIHTNSAPATVTRLIDLGIAPYLIASSLGGVLAQRLLRKLCPHCAQEITAAERQRCRQLGLDPTSLKSPRGCSECGEQGFQGRIPVYSLLKVNEAVQDAIRSNKGESEIERIARGGGYQSLAEDALVLLYNGITSLAEVERVVGLLDEELPKSEQAAATTPQSIAPSAAIARKKLLLVEDDHDAREILAMVFERELFEVHTAADGYEALKQIHAGKPDVIVCDIMMPNLNGHELLHRLKANPQTAQIPILMLTAADTEDNELKLISAGADDFVSKASRTEILLARVRTLLARGAGG